MLRSHLFGVLLASYALGYDRLLGFDAAAEVETRSIDEIYQAAVKEGGIVTLWLGGDEHSGANGIKEAFESNFPGMTLNVTVNLSKYHSVHFDEQLTSNNVQVDSIAWQTAHDFPRLDAGGALLH